MIRIATEALLSSPPTAVWRVLTDFAAFPEWNPLVLQADAAAAPGGRLRLLVAWPDMSGRRGWVRVKIDEWREGERLAWTGGPWPIFRGHHWFELVPEGAGTRLRHGEDMTGLFPWLARRTLGARFRPGYEALNRALAGHLAAAA
jgi:uncharacterized protein YndB with AHSA1/START domain